MYMLVGLKDRKLEKHIQEPWLGVTCIQTQKAGGAPQFLSWTLTWSDIQ